MNLVQPSPPLRGWLVVVLLVLPCLLASPARGDVGIESVSRQAGVAGDPARLTLGCGFCLSPCVGGPGRHHPPRDFHGACTLGARAKPPVAFPIWLTPLKHSLGPYRCRPADACVPGSARPPHLPSFTYLGRAVYEPDLTESGDVPRYRIVFQVPPVRPGRYKYVIYCDACYDGPRGSLIDDRTAAGRLRVLPTGAGADHGGGGSGPWIGGGIAAAILLLTLGFLLRRNMAAGPQRLESLAMVYRRPGGQQFTAQALNDLAVPVAVGTSGHATGPLAPRCLWAIHRGRLPAGKLDPLRQDWFRCLAEEEGSRGVGLGCRTVDPPEVSEPDRPRRECSRQGLERLYA